LGVQATTITAWWDKGCPAFSVRHYARLTALARQHHFDAGMLVDDHRWTVELARAAVAASGLSQAAFAQLAGCHPALVRDAVQGRRRGEGLSRSTARPGRFPRGARGPRASRSGGPRNSPCWARCRTGKSPPGCRE